MANRKQANIPKFGDWKNGEASMPYTVVFDNVRNKKANPNFNPNDPSTNQEAVTEGPAAPRPNATPPQQMRGGGGERREERRHPPTTPPHGRPGEDALVPSFGIWNNQNPDVGYNFTGVFERVGEERNRARNPATATPARTDQANNSPYAMGSATHNTGYGCGCIIL